MIPLPVRQLGDEQAAVPAVPHAKLGHWDWWGNVLDGHENSDELIHALVETVIPCAGCSGLTLLCLSASDNH